MPRAKTFRQSLSPGQVAKRWGVSLLRVQELIDAGRLPAFQIPGAGSYGQAVRIPLGSIIQVESQWALAPSGEETAS